MALVGKSHQQRGLHRGNALLQQLFGLANADIFQITVGGDALRPGKGPEEGGAAQSGTAAELVQADMLGIAVLDEGTDLF